MTYTERNGFEIVRQGYDPDEVEQFLTSQADAWRRALDDAQSRIAQLEAEVHRMAPFEADAANLEHERAELGRRAEAAAAAQAQRLAELKDDVDRTQREAAADAEHQVAEARTRAATIVDEARRSAESESEAIRRRAEEEHQQLEARHQQRRAELDRSHAETVDRYDKIETALRAKVEELDSMRMALVTGLEAIATGGLAGMGEVADLMVAAGLDRPAEPASVDTDETPAIVVNGSGEPRASEDGQPDVSDLGPEAQAQP